MTDGREVFPPLADMRGTIVLLHLMRDHLVTDRPEGIGMIEFNAACDLHDATHNHHGDAIDHVHGSSQP
jgi:hypothetical protein